MTKLSTSTATFRVCGDDLNPEEITILLGCEPSQFQTKGEVFRSKKSGKEGVAKIGMWRLAADDRQPADIDAQVIEIINKLPSGIDIWKQLAAKYQLDILCGYFMTNSNEVFFLKPELMQTLSSREITLKMDIYAGGISER